MIFHYAFDFFGTKTFDNLVGTTDVTLYSQTQSEDPATHTYYVKVSALGAFDFKGRFDYVIEVIRQNLAIVWCMLVTVESILAAAGGLGFLIKNSDKMMNHGRIIALQLIILLVGLFIDFALTFLRKRLFRYSKI